MNKNLDTVYFRVKREDKYENICFTDLYDNEVVDILADKTDVWLCNMHEILLDVRNNLLCCLNTKELEIIEKYIVTIPNTKTIDKQKVLDLRMNIIIIASIFDIVGDEYINE